MYCPICNKDTTFAVYDSIDQGMCMNCGTILFEFSMIEKVSKINRLKEQEARIAKFELERSWDENPDMMGKW